MPALPLVPFYADLLNLQHYFYKAINSPIGSVERTIDFPLQWGLFLASYQPYELVRHLASYSVNSVPETATFLISYDNGNNPLNTLQNQSYYFALTWYADSNPDVLPDKLDRHVVSLTANQSVLCADQADPHQQAASSVAIYKENLDCIDTKCVDAVIICNNALDFNDLLFKLVGHYQIRQPGIGSAVYVYYNISLPDNLVHLQGPGDFGFTYRAEYFPLKQAYHKEYHTDLTECDVASLVYNSGTCQSIIDRHTCQCGNPLDAFITICEPNKDATLKYSSIEVIKKIKSAEFDFVYQNYWEVRKELCGPASLTCNNGCKDGCCGDICSPKPRITITSPKNCAEVDCKFWLRVHTNCKTRYGLFINDKFLGVFEEDVELKFDKTKKKPVHIRVELLDHHDHVLAVDEIKVYVKCHCHGHHNYGKADLVEQTQQTVVKQDTSSKIRQTVSQTLASKPKGCKSCGH